MLNRKQLILSLLFLILLVSGIVINYWYVWGNSDEIRTAIMTATENDTPINVAHIAWTELVAAILSLTFMIWLLLRYGKAVISSRPWRAKLLIGCAVGTAITALIPLGGLYAFYLAAAIVIVTNISVSSH